MIYKLNRNYFSVALTGLSCKTCHTPTVTWDTLYYGHLRGPVTLTPMAKRLAVTTSFTDLGLSRMEFKLPTFRMRGERSNQLRHPI